MVNKSDITVIIPVHKWDDKIEKMYIEARKSIPEDVKVIVSTVTDSGFKTTENIKSKITPTKGHVGVEKGITVIESNDGSSFQHLVNNGVKYVDTDWFSILEFDDEYNKIWFDNFIKYQEYNEQYNFFLPLNDLYNVEGGKDEFIGNGNEAPLAASFSDELGVIDKESLNDYFNFYLPGGIFRTKTWNEVGGLKEKIKLTFWYEFMLRATNKGEKFYVIPKVGYAHILGRDGSLMNEYRSTIDEKESTFWFKQAKKQCYFNIEKDVTYNPNAVVEEEPEEEDNIQE